MFKRLLSAFGVGGPSVDTVLDSPYGMPGQVVSGQVRIQGGSDHVEIGQIMLSLVTRMEMEFGDREGATMAEFHRAVVAQQVRVPAEQLVTVPFQLVLPWETPITAVGDAVLPGMSVGVRTELVIAGAPDKGDLDPVLVRPLPSQNMVLEAFGELGFRFHSADVEMGRLHGVRQELGFFQELEFFPPPQVSNGLNQVELTFVANPHELYVILEADKRAGLLRQSGDTFGRFHVTHSDAETWNWAQVIGQWLEQAAAHGHAPVFGHGHNPAFGGHSGMHHGHHGHGGLGVGGAVAGAAAGVVGGMMLGEVMEEVFEGEDEE